MSVSRFYLEDLTTHTGDIPDLLNTTLISGETVTEFDAPTEEIWSTIATCVVAHFCCMTLDLKL